MSRRPSTAPPPIGSRNPRERPAIVAAVAAAVIVLAFAWNWVDWLRLAFADAEVRAAAATTVTPYASSLGNALNKRLALVHGLSAFVAVEVARNDLDEEFPIFAESLRGSVPGVRDITLAPGFVVRRVFPVAGNEKVLGLDLLNNPRAGFSETVRRAIDTHQIATHGPLELIQGGVGLIARHVVFAGDRPWGAVGAVFDLPPILREANLDGLGAHYRFAVRRVGSAPFAGDGWVFDADPIVEQIHVPDGDWELAVVPAQGWDAAAAGRADRVPVAIAFLGIGFLAALVILLIAERRATLARLVDQRTRELDQARRDADHKADQLALAQRELEQFAFAAAHDLQEPVRAMGTHAQLLQREIGATLNEERSALLAQVVEGARRLKAQLHDIQSFLAESDVPLPSRPQPADKALDDALDTLARTIAQTAATVTRDPLPVLVADVRRLREILVALIGNALEYRHPDRRAEIHVGCRREGGFVVLTVRDNGIGIEPRYHEQIFDVFRRLHGRDEHPGTGMGLAIARKMAERLDGSISVASEPGRGSVFSVRLPAANQGAET